MNFFAKLSFILIIIASALPAQAQLHKKKVLMPDPLLQRPGKVLANTAIIRVTDNYTLAELSAIFDKNDFNILRPLMKRNKSLTFNQNIKGAELFSSGKKHEILKAESPLLRTYIIEFQGDMPPEVFCKRITKIYPIIEYAEPYKAYSILESTVNDPRSTDQAGLNNIRAFEAFEIFQGDTSVIIGIIDSGVNQYHEDLHEQIAPNWDEIPNNQIDDDQNGYIDDHIGYNFGALDDSEWGNTNHVNPHGTQVAGIAAAGTNNSIGIAGAAYNCRFFPLKMSQGQENSFIYGYDAIMYAAEREFDVINLSFGDGDFYSPVEQSIIDYAVSRGVAVVASGGNIGNGTVMQSTVYPAGYFGVLGVGETSQHDRVSGGSVLGFPVDIMAPGENNWTTALSGGYQQAPGGTSFAAPVISGAVAYARALYPELGPIQALEFVRQAVDNINDLNPSYEDLLPGRINYMKIIETDPMDIPAIVPLEVIYSNEEGEPLDRFSVGDKVNISIRVRNYLGTADELNFKLKKGFDIFNIISIADSQFVRNNIKTDEEFIIDGMSFTINEEYTKNVIFRVDISNEQGYSDFFKISFIPTIHARDFVNDSIRFSMSDNGFVGYSDNGSDPYGYGFSYKDYRFSELWTNSGIVASVDETKGVSAIFGDFTAIKKFISPEPNKSIALDNNAPSEHQSGLQITQEVEISDKLSTVARVNVTVQNTSFMPLQNVGVGYFLDWDVGFSPEENRVSYRPGALPPGLNESKFGAQMIEYTEDESYPVFGAAIYSKEDNAAGQSAGLNYDLISNLTRQDVINYLSTGKAQQITETDDVSMLVGVKFIGEMAPVQEKSCVICFGGADTKEELEYKLAYCLDSNAVSVDRFVYNTGQVSVYPNPASERITIESGSGSKFSAKLVNLSGESLAFSEEKFGGSLEMNLASFPPGVYYLLIETDDKTLFEKVTIIR